MVPDISCDIYLCVKHPPLKTLNTSDHKRLIQNSVACCNDSTLSTHLSIVTNLRKFKVTETAVVVNYLISFSKTT